MIGKNVKCCVDYPRHGLRLPDYAALITKKKWPQGYTLRVRFLDGDDDQKATVARYAVQWSRYANINFTFGDDPEAELRVSFRYSGSWSTIGTDAFEVGAGEPTTNFGWLSPGLPANQARAVVLHEFGHVLGRIHEHQNPAGGIPWNKQAVYDALSGPPNNWDRATIDHNMFETYDKEQTQYTDVDRQSIMMYPIDPTWVTDPKYAVGFNDDLSATDRSFIAKQYPR